MGFYARGEESWMLDGAISISPVKDKMMDFVDFFVIIPELQLLYVSPMSESFSSSKEKFNKKESYWIAAAAVFHVAAE